jgi:hypothetical protein
MNVPGCRSILLVKDEEPIREIVAEELMFRGFDVGEAETGDHATSLIDNPPWEFELLITDVDDWVAWDCRKFWGQAAITIVGYGSLADWNFCPKPEPSVPF